MKEPEIIDGSELLPPEPQRKMRMMRDIARSWLNQVSTPQPPGVRTGIEPLDQCIGSGLRPGNMVLIAADTGVGKSLLGFQIAAHNAPQGRVAYVSAEMPGEDLAMRYATARTKIPLCRQRDGEIHGGEWCDALDQDGEIITPGLHRVAEEMAELDIAVLDDCDFGIDEVEDEIAAVAPVRMVCIDYAQLVDSDEKSGTRAEAITRVSKRLRRLAAKQQCVVVAMVQVNRNSEGRTDKTLRLSDIADSGSLAKDSVLVMMIEREVSGPRKQEATIRVRKNRFGTCGEVQVRFDVATLTFGRRQ